MDTASVCLKKCLWKKRHIAVIAAFTLKRLAPLESAINFAPEKGRSTFFDAVLAKI